MFQKGFVFVIILGFWLGSCKKSSRDAFDLPKNWTGVSADESETKIQNLTQAILDFPGEPRYYYLRAKAYLNAANPKDALNDINRAERLEPNNGELAYLKAQILNALNDNLAIESAKRAEGLGVQSLDLFVLLADLNLKSENQTEALNYIIKAENIFPYSSELHIAKGKYAMVAGDTALALAQYKKAIVLGKNTYKPYRAIVDNYLNLTILDSALKYTKLGLKANPHNLDFELTKGHIYESAGVPDSAFKIFRGLVKKYPERTDIEERIANLYFKRRNFNSAFVLYEQLFKKSNENAKYLYRAAECYEKQGRYTDAKEYLENKGEDFEEEKDMKNMMSRLEGKLGIKRGNSPQNIESDSDQEYFKETVAAQRENENSERSISVNKSKPNAKGTEKVSKAKAKKKIEEIPEVERRIFQNDIGNIEKIQKRSGLNLVRDTTRRN
jgi:tetratricopeptide (TPR) repeat protein